MSRGRPAGRPGALALAVLVLAGGCRRGPDPSYWEAPPVPDARAAEDEAPGGVVTAPAEAPTAPPDAAPAEDAGAGGDEPDGEGPADAGAGPASEPTPEAALPDVRLPSFAGLFRRLSPSVVNIYTQEEVRQRLVDPWHPPIPQGMLGTSLGSGVVVDRHGFIVTNAHVVENAAEIRVRFHDDTEMPARLIGIDPVRDLALLKVDGATGLQPVVPGDSDGVEVGDWVLAIGNPLGLSHTLTKGIVSAKGRAELRGPAQGYVDLIQTDAAINRGSSGGPLFDLEGRIIGLNTAISAEGQGIAFAIPWSVVRDALPRLKQGGQVSRSWLGVFIRPVELRDGGTGVLVDAVIEDSPAMRGGLRPGDVVVALDGREVRSIPEFRLQVASGIAGRDLEMEVLRGKTRERVVVRLEEARGP